MEGNAGIAKTAAQAQPTEPIAIVSVADGIDALCHEQVPIDVYRFFDMDLSVTGAGDIKKLKAISDWAFTGSETLGDGLTKLRNLEIKLGSPSGNERRHDKLFIWVKMQQQVEELMKRQDSLRR